MHSSRTAVKTSSCRYGFLRQRSKWILATGQRGQSGRFFRLRDFSPLSIFLSRARAPVWLLSLFELVLYQLMCFTLEKGVLWHSCVKVSGKNTLPHSASQVLLSPPGLKWWKSVYLRWIKAGRCLVAVCWRFSRGQFRMSEPGSVNLQTLIISS